MKNQSRLPNMRNLGVILRMLIIVNIVVSMAAYVLSTNLADFFIQIALISTLAQPILLASVFILYLANTLLSKLKFLHGLAVSVLLVLLSSLLVHRFFTGFLLVSDLPALSRVLFSAFVISAICLYYFHLLHRAQSPAVTEARLQALQARIRPHFLFNSINAVLSLIRSQPKQAESALEDMADLFRVLMEDNRELVPLAREIGLCRQYLALEKLRLSERLQVQWQIDNMPPDAMIPPLILQPLLENAVYHGIEPLAEGGTISIQIYTKLNEIHLVLKNPINAQGYHHQGNKMALNNIKERLKLHFDLEASLSIKQTHGEYEVHIRLPYRK
jgi:two-component system sensor histidine kinase AlgZ